MTVMTAGIERACEAAYDIMALAVTSLRHTGYAIRRHRLLTKHLYDVGNKSLLIVGFFGLFIGMILVLYGGDQLERFNQEKYIGLTGLAIIWEFGPVFTAFIVAGRIGSAWAAEIGTMKVYDEVDALRSMGIKPEAYLAAPRLLACALLLPVLIVYADFAAITGGAGMAWVTLRVPPGEYFRVFFQFLDFDEMSRSLIKGLVFGVIIAVVGCYHGFKTTGGAEGVGRSTTLSVVHSLTAILVADYFISKILLVL